MDTPRQPLSEFATAILERMDPDRAYGPEELQMFLPDLGLERLREIMHELWIDRQVERVGDFGWQRAHSQAPHRREPPTGGIQPAKPEDLFDHAPFADFFK